MRNPPVSIKYRFNPYVRPRCETVRLSWIEVGYMRRVRVAQLYAWPHPPLCYVPNVFSVQCPSKVSHCLFYV